MTPPRKPRAKPCKVTTTPFPKAPTAIPPAVAASLRQHRADLTQLTAALDAQRERIDGIEARVRQQNQDICNLHGDFVMQRTRPALAARVRAWWRGPA